MSKIFRISKSRNPEGDFAGGSGIGKTPLAFVLEVEVKVTRTVKLKR